VRTKVFAHKGIVGIMSSYDADGLINNPEEKGQLGFVVNASYVDISPDALDLIKKIKKSGDDIGEVDVYMAGNDDIVFSWLGGQWKMFKPEQITGSSEFDPYLLESSSNVLPDPGFVASVDKLLMNEIADKVAPPSEG